MLTKHPKLLTTIANTVKSAAIVGLTAMSMAAYAHGYEIMEEKFTVKFKLSEIHAPNGVETVYAKLKKRATRACAFDTGYLENGDIMSKAECTADLLGQFIATANVTELTNYHDQQSTAR